MRWICWASLFVAMFVLSSPAAGVDSGHGWARSCASCGQGYTYGAPPCGAPFFGWQPGCCQEPPSPCDNAWAGYCEEKARWKAFCYRLGTGGRSCGGSMPGDCQPLPASVQAAGPPSPAAPGKVLGPSAPGLRGQPPVVPAPGGGNGFPVPVTPGDPAEPPLPPEPGDVQEPVALPPLRVPGSEETTQRWDRFWLPSGNARIQPANWTGVR